MLLFVGFFSKAEPICALKFDALESPVAEEGIQVNCKKNDILSVIITKFDYDNVEESLKFLRSYCRFDREIIFKQIDKKMLLSCVLNSNEPRPVRGG